MRISKHLIVVTLTLLLVQLVAATPASARVYVPWSDCFYASPLPGETANVHDYTIKVDGTIVVLDCGTSAVHGVRHIKAGHGFDSDAEACICHVLLKADVPVAGSGPNNYVYRIQRSGLSTFVVVNRLHYWIVTAYTNGSNTGNWIACKSI